MLENTELEMEGSEAENTELETEAIEADEAKYLSPSAVYQNNNMKAEENKASAWSLLIVGFVGVVVVVLSWFEKLPFSIGGSRNLLSHSVLFAFFVIFIILGIVSALNVKKYTNLISVEQNTKNDILEYLKANFSKESLEELTTDSDEEAYFHRMTFMREKFKADFEENKYDETLLEALLDDYYDSLFG